MRLPFVWRPAPSAGVDPAVVHRSRWGRSTWRRRSAPSPGSSPRRGCRAAPCRSPTASPGASAPCASGTASSPATACTCARSTGTGGCAPSTSPPPPASPTGSRRSGATACSSPARWSTSSRAPGPGGVGIATGELYNVDEDPHQFENRWDDPAHAAPARRPGGRPLRQPAHRGAHAQGDGAGLTAGTGAPGVARSMAPQPWRARGGHARPRGRPGARRAAWRGAGRERRRG